jgi:exonuclease SbcD
VRFLHTSDWHLGRSFLGVSLLDDQAHVLEQLVELVRGADLDAVLIAGDVYDRLSPPPDAVQLLDEVLTRLVVDCRVPVVLIAGNHDSAERLGFGSRLLDARGLHVAGPAPRSVRFEDRHGVVEVVAVPYAEPGAVAARLVDPEVVEAEGAMRAELAAMTGPAGTRSRSGTAAEADSATGHASGRRIVVAHAFVAGGSTSESERPLVLGNAALVSPSCFDAFGYAALGHLHRPQRVGRAEVRYSGSLLKYSFDEAAHRKSVSIVEMDADGSCRIEEVALRARRDVRVLEGTLEEIRRSAETDTSRDDYVLARLTDRGAILDAIGKVRDLYPNCLRVDREAFFSARSEDAGPRLDLRQHGEAELFDAFFAEVTGAPPDEDEARAFADALVAVRARGAEA